MIDRMIFPPEPGEQPAQPPMVYVRKTQTWEYQQITRRLDQDGLFPEVELNALGAQGWELCGILSQENQAHYYFKRPGR